MVLVVSSTSASVVQAFAILHSDESYGAYLGSAVSENISRNELAVCIFSSLISLPCNLMIQSRCIELSWLCLFQWIIAHFKDNVSLRSLTISCLLLMCLIMCLLIANAYFLNKKHFVSSILKGFPVFPLPTFVRCISWNLEDRVFLYPFFINRFRVCFNYICFPLQPLAWILQYPCMTIPSQFSTF